jgi:hypothetical protein
MLIYLIIKKNELIDIVKLRYWLKENSNKWILYNDELTIYIIFSCELYERMDCIVRSIKTGLVSSGKCVFISKLEKHIFKAKMINKNEIFYKILKETFFKSFDKNSEIDYFRNIELNGYSKKYVISLLKKESNFDNNEIEEKICQSCSKKFTTIFNKNRHEKKCNDKSKLLENKKSNIKNDVISHDDIKEMKDDIISTLAKTISQEIKDSVESMFQKINENHKSSVNINSNNVNNNVNVQINNYSSKKDKLNKALKNIIDLDTFIEKYENDPKFHLTKDESQVLLENSENLGVSSYGEGLYSYIKKKYSLQLAELTGGKNKFNENILPFVCKDVNFRNHYELTQKGWEIVNSKDKIKKIVNISDNQIFKHHNKFIYYKKRGKGATINLLLTNSNYAKIEPILDKLIEDIDNNEMISLNDTTPPILPLTNT